MAAQSSPACQKYFICKSAVIFSLSKIKQDSDIVQTGPTMRNLAYSLSAILAAAILPTSATADIAEVFGQADSAWDAQVSPDGASIALGCGANGVKAVCIYDLVGGGQPRLFFPGEEFRIQNFYWAGDNYLITNAAVTERLSTSSGLKEFEIHRALSYNMKTAETEFLMNDESGWDNLTNVVATCDAQPDNVVMALTVRADRGARTGSRMGRSNQGFRTVFFDVNLRTGKSKARPAREASVFDALIGPDCQPVVNVLYNDQRGDFAIERASDGETLFALEDAFVWPMDVVGRSVDGDTIIVRSDTEELYGMHALSLSDGALKPLSLDGYELGRAGIVRDPFTGSVIGFSATEHLTEHLYLDEELETLQRLVENALPGHFARVRSFARDRSLFTIVAEKSGSPASFYLYDTTLKELSPLGDLAPQLQNRTLGTVEAISYAARDGLQIPGYLTLPPGKTRRDGPFRLVLMPHGGPEARDTASFDWWSQAYAAAGYAVLQPNFRGSAGYGQTFRDAGFGEFGGKMVDDVVDAIAWAEEEGLSDTRGVCIAGASYGGYSALMTALKAPDKVGCAVAVAPLTDVFGHLARFNEGTSVHNYWMRYAGSSRRGDTEEISPSARANEIKADVLLIHGEDDTVVKINQSYRFKNNWGRRGGLEFIELEGQDHFLTTTLARQTVLRESLELFADHHPAQ